MNYCYARVSTTEQHLDRQIAQFEEFKPYELFTDKESGKDFDRPSYKRLKRKIKAGDTLIVLSLDRFGRNYDLIKQEWQWFSNKGVKIKVIDMPIIDTTSDDLTSRLISDIVIQLLSYVAETERTMIKKRQREGIEMAKLRGVKFGRPKIDLPDNFHDIAEKYQKGNITNLEACEELSMSRGTFFRYLKTFNYDEKIPKVRRVRNQEIHDLYQMFQDKKIKSDELSRLSGEELKVWYPKYKSWQRKQKEAQ